MLGFCSFYFLFIFILGFISLQFELVFLLHNFFYLHPNFSCNLLSFTFLLLLPVFILNRTSFIIFFFHLFFSYPSAEEEQIIKIQLLFTFSNLIGDDNYLLNALYISYMFFDRKFIYIRKQL